MTRIDFDKLHPGDPSCPSDLALDKWHAEALEAAEQASVDDHLKICEVCVERIELRRAGHAAFPALDESRMLSAISRQLSDPQSPSPSGPICIGGLAQRNPVLQ